MPPTQKELARLAGVSAGTVSNVISGAAGVSDRSREKVLAAIKTLNYRPNLIARSLRTNRTCTIGMVIPDITVPFFPKVIRGAEAAAREAGYYLTVLDSEGSQERETAMLELLRSQRVEGVLLITVGGHEVPHNLPIVYLDRLPEGLTVDSVCVDDASAAESAVSHLIQQGHRRIAVVTGPSTLTNEHDRLAGYRRALRKAHLPIDNSLICQASFDHAHVESLLRPHLANPATRPTALFATNGVTGLAAIKTIYTLGLTTPRDIACITFDELTSEEFFRPSISSVVQPAADIGARAVEVLLNRIRNPHPHHPPEKIRLPATLIVRESSRTPFTP